MALYEHVFLARQDISAQQVEALTEQYKTIIAENGGTVGKVEYWGVRPLSFRIRKNRKAHYSLMNIDAPHQAVAEMERQMRISDDVLRFLTVRVEAHDEQPSPVLARRGERDGRDGRGGRGGRDRDRERDRERDRRPAESARPAEAEAATKDSPKEEA